MDKKDIRADVKGKMSMDSDKSKLLIYCSALL